MNTNDMSMIDGEPDTSRGVRPVPREGVGNLPPHGGKAPLPYPTICSSPTPPGPCWPTASSWSC